MKQIRTTIESPYEPNDNGALWLDTSNPDAPILKAFTNGKWQATIGGEKVTEISSDSTDEEMPTAKAVNDRITALADEVVKPIKMLSLPEPGDALEDVFNAGMTLSEIEAASRGERNGVVVMMGRDEKMYLPILLARYLSENNWEIQFCCMYYTPSGVLDGATGRYFHYEGGTFVIESIEM